MTESEPQMDRLRMLAIRRLQEMGTKGKPLSPNAALARHPDATISRAHFYSVLNGRRSNRFGDRVLHGLATVLEVSPEVVYEMADEPRPQSRWLWPETFDRVAPEHRGMFEDLVSAFLAAERRGYERGRQYRE